MINIKYKKRTYKYVLAERVVYQMTNPIFGLSSEIGNAFVRLTPGGLLTIEPNYAWDGASGPTIDTFDTMAGSLVHDAGYQMMREGLLPLSNKESFDQELKLIMLCKGAMPLRASYYYIAVQRYGWSAMMTPQPLLEA